METWLETPFDGGRHQRRVEKIKLIEKGMSPVVHVTEGLNDTLNQGDVVGQ